MQVKQVANFHSYVFSSLQFKIDFLMLANPLKL